MHPKLLIIIDSMFGSVPDGDHLSLQLVSDDCDHPGESGAERWCYKYI